MSDIPCTSGQLSHLSVDPCDPGTVKVRLRENLCAQQVLCKILDLVDRYWNGTKSLHHHDKFLGTYMSHCPVRLLAKFIPCASYG